MDWGVNALEKTIKSFKYMTESAFRDLSKRSKNINFEGCVNLKTGVYFDDDCVFKVCCGKNFGYKCLDCEDASVIDCEINILMREYLENTETWD